ncbi:MAG: DUF935 family protein, partial [Thiomargarita sp.]|nr:DUF935 family protein [Thiomargarita sp.]
MIDVNSLNRRIEPWSTAATNDEKRQAAELSDVLENIMDIPELLMNLAYGILPGFSMIEIIDIENPIKSGWTKIALNGRNIWYPKMAFRPLSWFQTNSKHRDVLFLRDQQNGIPLKKGLWVQHKHPLMPGNIGNTGCMRSLAYAYLIKNHGIQDWTELLSILGVPPRIGFYDANTPPQDKVALRLAVQALGKNASAIMPKGMDIEYQSAAQITSNPFIEIVTYAEKVYQELILGVSMSDIAKKTSVEGSKFLSNATYQRNKWDAHYLEQTIRRDILYYMNGFSYGVWDMLKTPKFKFDIRITGEFGSQADGLLKIAQTGLKIGKAWAHEHLNIPIPKDGEEVLNPDDFKSDDNQAELKKKVVALKKEDDVDIIEDVATAASMESDKILGDLMKAMETAKDYDE